MPPVATAEPVHYFSGRVRRRAVASSTMPDRPADRAIAVARQSDEGTGRLMARTGIKRDEVQRQRCELGRDGVGGPSPVIAARRRLRGTRPGAVRNRPTPFGPRYPRFDYLTHSHDWRRRASDGGGQGDERGALARREDCMTRHSSEPGARVGSSAGCRRIDPLDVVLEHPSGAEAGSERAHRRADAGEPGPREPVRIAVIERR